MSLRPKTYWLSKNDYHEKYFVVDYITFCVCCIALLTTKCIAVRCEHIFAFAARKKKNKIVAE